MGKIEKWSRDWTVERGRTRDSMVVAGVTEACGGQDKTSLSKKPVGWTGWYAAAWSLHSDSTLRTLPNCTIALLLCNDRMSKINNSSFSGLDLLKRPLWSVLPLEVTVVVSAVYCPGSCRYLWSYSSQDPYWCPWPKLPTKAIQKMSLVWATTWGHADVHGPCSCRREAT